MNLVTAYTRRALTYPSDILVALQGFVNELQKLSPLDEFVMGIWWRDADAQLAWVSDEGSRRRTSEGLDIPSWSRASRARSIRFRLINTWVISSTYATGSAAVVEFGSN